MTASPWKTHSTRTVYENDWITVFEDQVTTPAHTPGIYGRVCMKNKAIGIIPIDEEGFTWIVGQYRYALSEYSWEIPMGGGARNETAAEAAKRELREETGLEANELRAIARVHTSNSVTDEEGWVFIATDLRQVGAKPDETEALKVIRLSLDEAIEMVKDGRITDGISMIGLLRVKDFLA
jgi:8-oxo-dGDP phosphatase